MAFPNHNTDNAELTVYKMVLNRLPYLTDNPTNESLISAFTLEAMHELEPCYRVRFTEDGTEDWTRVGDEALYTVMQRSIIADLVAIYIIMTTMVATTGGSSGTPNLTTYIKKAKAGSVEVEYDQFKVKDGAMLSIDGKSLLEKLKADIMRKSRTQGCTFDICDDCTIALAGQNNVAPPFMHFGGGCGCG